MPNYLIMYKIYVWNPFRLMYIGVSGLVSKEKKDSLLAEVVKFKTNPIIAIPFFGYHWSN